MACNNLEWYKERYEKTKAIIEAIEDALEQLATDGIKSYQLNTGQNDTRVTNLDIPDLEARVDSLYNRLNRFCEQIAILEGGNDGNIQAVPAW